MAQFTTALHSQGQRRAEGRAFESRRASAFAFGKLWPLVWYQED